MTKASAGWVLSFVAVVALTTQGGAGAQEPATAHSGTGSGRIRACVHKGSGLVRIVDRENDCRPFEEPISWSVRGNIEFEFHPDDGSGVVRGCWDRKANKSC